jgi:hypothetical protein
VIFATVLEKATEELDDRRIETLAMSMSALRLIFRSLNFSVEIKPTTTLENQPKPVE